MREIVLDTETTGINTDDGHRIVEIGCVELIDKVRTGRFFHKYINPQRDMPQDAQRIHGLSAEFLSDKPLFSLIAEEFIEFIQDSALIMHNAPFDVRFINNELKLINLPPLTGKIIDTLVIARNKFADARSNSLDALCKRFKIDLSSRNLHGALLDAELLVKVYVELTREEQGELKFGDKASNHLRLEAKKREQRQKQQIAEYAQRRLYKITAEELEDHKKLLEKINKPIWAE